MQANFRTAAWPDLSPPSCFPALLAVVFPKAPCQMSLLPLTKDGAPLNPTDFLRPDELGEWQSFASGKRRQEWLGGRLCAYDRARWLTNPTGDTAPFPVRDWRLANAEDGHPFWQGNIPEFLHGTNISISHGGGYALAVTARSPVGADVQLCSTKVERVAEQFAARQEENILTRLAPEEDRLNRLTLLWSAKESLRKAACLSGQATGPPAFLAMRLTAGRREIHGWSLILAWQQTGHEVSVAATLHDGHAFAFCLLEE